MAKVTQASIVDAVAATLGTATAVSVCQSYNQLRYDVHDAGLLQVYPQRGESLPGGDVDRRTFQAGVRVGLTVVHADFYAARVAHAAEGMAALVVGVDSIETVLEAQDTKPYFGLEGIKAFQWTWDRVIFATSSHQYQGARFVLSIRVF